MTEDKFTELVNLYLDKEISERGLAQLKSELAINAERKDDFVERCRMCQATRMALNSKSPKRSYEIWRNKSSSSSRSSRPKLRDQRIFSYTSRSADSFLTSEKSKNHLSHKVATFPRWITAISFAASLALGFALLMPFFRDSSAVSSQPVIKGVEVKDLLEVDLMDRISHREIRRFANVQAQRKANQEASLAAQHLIMGLSPELTTKKKQFRSISVAASQRPDVVRDQAELLMEVQKVSAMPSPKILRVESMQSEPAALWPGSFQSSLASFK
ncbi:MAG: hypothetical protein VXY17_03815 [Verrucomicrobiota bacterium]|nr:hypothetical protein [Verrucomicrobiota bacterium]